MNWSTLWVVDLVFVLVDAINEWHLRYREQVCCPTILEVNYLVVVAASPPAHRPSYISKIISIQ